MRGIAGAIIVLSGAVMLAAGGVLLRNETEKFLCYVGLIYSAIGWLLVITEWRAQWRK